MQDSWILCIPIIVENTSHFQSVVRHYISTCNSVFIHLIKFEAATCVPNFLCPLELVS